MWREIVGLGDQASLATSKAMHGIPFYGPTLDSRPVPARLFLLCGPLRKHVLLHDLSGERRIARGRDKYLASYYLGKLRLTLRTINFSLETPSGRTIHALTPANVYSDIRLVGTLTSVICN